MDSAGVLQRCSKKPGQSCIFVHPVPTGSFFLIKWISFCCENVLCFAVNMYCICF